MLRFTAAAIALASVLASLQALQPGPPTLDARAAIPYFIENGRGVPGYRDTDRELARFALDAWSRESGGVLKFSEASEASAIKAALIRIRWVSSGGGTYGETEYVRVNGKPGAIVNVMPDVSLQGEPLAGFVVHVSMQPDVIVIAVFFDPRIEVAAGVQHVIASRP